MREKIINQKEVKDPDAIVALVKEFKTAPNNSYYYIEYNKHTFFQSCIFTQIEKFAKYRILQFVRENRSDVEMINLYNFSFLATPRPGHFFESSDSKSPSICDDLLSRNEKRILAGKDRLEEMRKECSEYFASQTSYSNK